MAELKLQNFEDISYINEESKDFLFSETEDIEKLQNLKIVSQSFLRVNNFDTSYEPDFSTLSDEQFIEYIENTNKESILSKKFDEFNVENTFRSIMSGIYQHKENKDLRIFIFFAPDDKSKGSSIGKSEITKFIALLLDLDCLEGIFISEKALSASSKERILNCNINPEGCSNLYNVMHYRDEDFVDITDHSFVPEILQIYRNGEETEKFKQDYNLILNKLPRMLNTDPMVKFYRGKTGDIFKMKRKTVHPKNILDYQIIFKIVVQTVNKKSK